MNMAIKLVFGSIRGGVGKTTISKAIALLLAEQKRKTLLIDLDPSASVTYGLKNGIIGDLLDDQYVDVYEAMQQKDLRKGIHKVLSNLDLIPASNKLHNFSKLLPSDSSDTFIRDLVSEIEDDYDFIIFDLSPIVDVLNVNGLVASDYVIPILDTTTLLMQNTTYLQYIEEIQSNQQNPLQILGMVASLLDTRGQTETAILESASAPVKNLLFETIITNTHKEGAKSVEMYESLLEEILIRLKLR